MYEKILVKYGRDRENLIGILHEIQDSEPANFVNETAVKEVSDWLHVPPNHIYGVLSFYTMFSTSPRGRHVIRLCESPPCFHRGSAKILDHLKAILDVHVGQTTADGEFTLELCACLGVCGNAPVMMIDETVYGDLTPERCDEIIRTLRGGIE